MRADESSTTLVDASNPAPDNKRKPSTAEIDAYAFPLMSYVKSQSSIMPVKIRSPLVSTITALRGCICPKYGLALLNGSKILDSL